MAMFRILLSSCAMTLCCTSLLRAQTDWQQLPLRRPVEYPAAAFDLVRDRLVVFGGRDYNYQELGTTLEWDGSGWQTRTPSVAPAARYGAAAAFDAARGVVVLFGGARRGGPYGDVQFGDTWEWDGSTWTERLPATSPSPRSLSAMTYDSTRRRVLLFGGSTGMQVIGETWEWDGSTWTRRQPLHEPYGRQSAAMAYDPGRDRVVLFGGNPHIGPIPANDTWEWDGSDWTDRSPQYPQPSPEGVDSHGMAFDPARQRIVLFGGAPEPVHFTEAVWEWDGVGWRERVLPPGPVGRSGFACGFDAARQRLLVYSGMSWNGLAPDLWAMGSAGWQRLDPGQQPWLDVVQTGDLAWDGNRNAVIWHGGNPEQPRQTWELRADAWHPVTEGQGPVGIEELRLCWLPTQQRVVAYQPRDSGPDATWTFDGTNWTQLQPLQPPGLFSAAMALDPRGDRLVLFGQGTPSSAATFWFDGSAWSMATTAVAPAPRSGHAMVLDEARQRVVLFGGYAQSPQALLGDTWEWDGAAWLLRTPAVAPSPRSGHGLAFDSGRRRVVLSGNGETWEWDGNTWAQRQPATPSATSWWQRLCYEPNRGTVAALVSPPTSTWRHGPLHPGSVTPFGQGCGGSLGAPLLRTEADQRPYTGSRFHLAVERLPDPVGFLLLGWSNTSWFGVVPLPAALGPLGYPQCALLVQTDEIAVLSLVQGTASWSLWIPNQPGLLGCTLHAQGMAFDPAGPAGLAMTAGATCSVGGL